MRYVSYERAHKGRTRVKGGRAAIRDGVMAVWMAPALLHCCIKLVGSFIRSMAMARLSNVAIECVRWNGSTRAVRASALCAVLWRLDILCECVCQEASQYAG